MSALDWTIFFGKERNNWTIEQLTIDEFSLSQHWRRSKCGTSPLSRDCRTWGGERLNNVWFSISWTNRNHIHDNDNINFDWGNVCLEMVMITTWAKPLQLHQWAQSQCSSWWSSQASCWFWRKDVKNFSLFRSTYRLVRGSTQEKKMIYFRNIS